MIIRTSPNVHTIVAPVGRSSCNDRYTPRAETKVPIDHPMASRRPIVSAYNIAATEGRTQPPTVRQMGRFLAGDYTGSLFSLAVVYLIPVIIASQQS